ncbi:DoxX family protein [Planococcus lenghuensis]|uniref:Oxidoreductase n=1 Tax=Planococcus lenghuensis TaxID=2213202 RepID=A0A1Q2L2J5_9BACL|nr:DoxX family protein [Planococcus lenghuensis]AQQ54633.1 oxidoreductase [Planococcus lenghuensis]
MYNKYEVSALILRLVLGMTFFIHGMVKFQGGIENTVGWFTSIGLPGVLAYGVASLEVAGGIALVLGLLTRWVSVLLGVLMLGAILKVKLAVGFLGNGQMAGYELDLAFLAIAVSLAITGSKAFALDWYIAKERGKEKAVSVN